MFYHNISYSLQKQVFNFISCTIHPTLPYIHIICMTRDIPLFQHRQYLAISGQSQYTNYCIFIIHNLKYDLKYFAIFITSCFIIPIVCDIFIQKHSLIKLHPFIVICEEVLARWEMSVCVNY